MEDSVTMRLSHSGMNVKTRIAKLCDASGQQFHSLNGIAEDDRLIDLQLKKSKTWKLAISLQKWRGGAGNTKIRLYIYFIYMF